MAMIVPSRAASFSQLAKRLRSSNTRVVEGTLLTPAAPRSEAAQEAIPTDLERRSGPLRRPSEAQDQRPREPIPTPNVHGPENLSASTHSPQESARTVQAIYGAFKGKTFSGDALRGIILLRPGLGGEAEATAREHAARRDARLQPFGRAREKGVAHWPVTRSRPVVHLQERPVTG